MRIFVIKVQNGLRNVYENFTFPLSLAVKSFAGLLPPIPNSYSIQRTSNVRRHWTNRIVATSSIFTGSFLVLILTAAAVMNFQTLLFIFFSKEVISALKH